MTPILAISLLYGLMSFGAINILYFSFKGKTDYSSRFFLSAEVLLLFTATYLSLVSLGAIHQNPLATFLGNFLYIAAETSILFSIYTLTQSISIKKYLVAIFCSGVYALLVEYARTINPLLPFLLSPLVSAFVISSTIFLCAKVQDQSLKKNPFLIWFVCMEAGLLCITLLRIMAYFLNVAMAPLGPTLSAVLIYLAYVTINLFRFISYQSLRITWVSPASGTNFLNKQLAQSAAENNELLQGLINSNRVLGVSALAGSLAHQLSQPLTGAALQLESVKRELINSNLSNSSITSLNKISSQLSRLAELIKNLRKLFATKTDEFMLFNLQQANEEIIELMESALKTKQIKLTKSYLANPFVNGNAIQIQQVLINILNNAIESLEISRSQNKVIHITIDSNSHFAILSIEDSGAGINKSILPAIFDLYQTSKGDGMGIGLWLSKAIIDKHCGSISAANRSTCGAIFTIHIPLAERS